MIHTRWFTLQPGFQQQSVSFLELIKDGGMAEDELRDMGIMNKDLLGPSLPTPTFFLFLNMTQDWYAKWFVLSKMLKRNESLSNIAGRDWFFIGRSPHHFLGAVEATRSCVESGYS